MCGPRCLVLRVTSGAAGEADASDVAARAGAARARRLRARAAARDADDAAVTAAVAASLGEVPSKRVIADAILRRKGVKRGAGGGGSGGGGGSAAVPAAAVPVVTPAAATAAPPRAGVAATVSFMSLASGGSDGSVHRGDVDGDDAWLGDRDSPGEVVGVTGDGSLLVAARDGSGRVSAAPRKRITDAPWSAVAGASPPSAVAHSVVNQLDPASPSLRGSEPGPSADALTEVSVLDAGPVRAPGRPRALAGLARVLRAERRRDFRLTAPLLGPVAAAGPVGVLAAAAASATASSSSAANTQQRPVVDDRRLEVWSCGQNAYGELGHPDNSARKSFARSTALCGRGIIDVACGNEHTVALTAWGEVFSFGLNDNAQLGHDRPGRLSGLSVMDLPNVSVAAVHAYNGCEHSMMVSTTGELFATGYNHTGQLGHGVGEPWSPAVPVRALAGRVVTLVGCSYFHSMIVCADGTVFGCGKNECGQLGHGDTVDRKRPAPLPRFAAAEPPVQTYGSGGDVVSVGCGQFHTAFVLRDGRLMTCGKNEHGQLGHETATNRRTPTRVGGALAGRAALSVRCGYFHTVVVASGGDVFACGRNDHGQAGLGTPMQRVFGMQPISALRDRGATSVAAGCYHTVVVGAGGLLWVFGRNNHGQLGTGDLTERAVPHAVTMFAGRRIASVACGFYHTVVLVGAGDENGGPAATVSSPPALPPWAPVALLASSPFRHTSDRVSDVVADGGSDVPTGATHDAELSEQPPSRGGGERVSSAAAPIAIADASCMVLYGRGGGAGIRRPVRPQPAVASPQHSQLTRPSEVPHARVADGHANAAPDPLRVDSAPSGSGGDSPSASDGCSQGDVDDVAPDGDASGSDECPGEWDDDSDAASDASWVSGGADGDGGVVLRACAAARAAATASRRAIAAATAREALHAAMRGAPTQCGEMHAYPAGVAVIGYLSVISGCAAPAAAPGVFVIEPTPLTFCRLLTLLAHATADAYYAEAVAPRSLAVSPRPTPAGPCETCGGDPDGGFEAVLGELRGRRDRETRDREIRMSRSACGCPAVDPDWPAGAGADDAHPPPATPGFAALSGSQRASRAGSMLALLSLTRAAVAALASDAVLADAVRAAMAARAAAACSGGDALSGSAAGGDVVSQLVGWPAGEVASADFDVVLSVAAPGSAGASSLDERAGTLAECARALHVTLARLITCAPSFGDCRARSSGCRPGVGSGCCTCACGACAGRGVASAAAGALIAGLGLFYSTPRSALALLRLLCARGGAGVGGGGGNLCTRCSLAVARTHLLRPLLTALTAPGALLAWPAELLLSAATAVVDRMSGEAHAALRGVAACEGGPGLADVTAAWETAAAPSSAVVLSVIKCVARGLGGEAACCVPCGVSCVVFCCTF